jgi:short subunit dehydrogenase-like uncharacterized protein
MSERDYEIVLFGASGFTGELTAEYLARNLPDGTRWALAGRSRARLEAVRDRLTAANPAAKELPLLVGDAGAPETLGPIARSAKVVITTVGPYLQYGEPLVAACAAAGTDYADLTGEPEFVDRMWLNYNEQAKRTGARLVHSCGFDSIPYDLGAFYTVGQLPLGVPIALQGFGRMAGSFSGGTYHSAVGAVSRLAQSSRVARERRQRERAESTERQRTRKVRGVAGRPHNEPHAGGWVVPAPTIDPQVVLRSARGLDRYGPDFSYSHYIVAGQLKSLALLMGGAGAGIALAQLKPTRSLLLKLKAPGEGPTPEQRARSYFRVLFIADADGRRLLTQVSGGDPGYGETSKMLAESAMCLAFDELPERAGQLTTAVAMGDRLLARLQRAEIEFKVLPA